MASYRAIPTEHEEQKNLISWCKMSEGRYPELAFIHACPNGAQRPTKMDAQGRTYSPEGVKLKAEGVKKGVPDLFLDAPRRPFHGLRIEMKRRQGGTVSDDQKIWLNFYDEQGYRAVVCEGWEEAKDIIVDYLELPKFA